MTIDPNRDDGVEPLDPTEPDDVPVHGPDVPPGDMTGTELE
jgi:hypothetical protein